MSLKFFLELCIALMIGILIGFATFIALSTKSTPLETVEITCHTFHVATSGGAPGYVFIGQIELCGENLEWSTIWGPIGAEKPEKVIPRGEPQGILQ